MKNRKTLYYGIVFILCLGLCACFSPLDYKGSQGTISLTLPGEGSAARAAVSPPGWRYELEFSGPDGKYIPITARAGETVSLRVEPGTWIVSVIALKPGSRETWEKVADGSDTINVKPGIKNMIEIPMAITSTAGVRDYLAAQRDGGFTANPVRLPLAVELSNNDWINICNNIEGIEIFVDMDLTRCTGTHDGALDEGGVFDPRVIDLSPLPLPFTSPAGVAFIVRLTLPEAATSIADGTETVTFDGFDNLQHVTIGNGVEEIGDYAFYAVEMTSVTFGNKVETIGKGAFHSVPLTRVTIPNSVKEIGDSAFYSCDLTSVTIGKDVTTIGDDAFRECEQLASVTIGSSVMTIGNSAFRLCDLRSVTIPAGVTDIGEYAFAFNGNLTSVTFLGGKIAAFSPPEETFPGNFYSAYSGAGTYTRPNTNPGTPWTKK